MAVDQRRQVQQRDNANNGQDGQLHIHEKEANIVRLIFQRMRSEVTSRSNCGKDKRTFSVNRPIGCSGVELLGDGDKRHPMGIEQFDQLWRSQPEIG